MTIIDPMGKFVKVGTFMGVIVGLPGTGDIPEDHFAIWYGQKSPRDAAIPYVRTVPIEYCLAIETVHTYH